MKKKLDVCHLSTSMAMIIGVWHVTLRMYASYQAVDLFYDEFIFFHP